MAAIHRETFPPAMADLSIEVNHFYEGDLHRGNEWLTREFARFAFLVEAFSEGRTSLVHMVDDYHIKRARPVDTMQRIVHSARQGGIELDYIIREGACVDYAQTLYDRLRKKIPPVHEDLKAHEFIHIDDVSMTGRDCEQRYGLQKETRQAMHFQSPELPYATRMVNDIQVFSTEDPNKKGNPLLTHTGVKLLGSWACCHLAAIFQGLRLGMPLDEQGPPLRPVLTDIEDLPDSDRWEDFPALMQLTPDAPPFQAERVCSLLPSRYLRVEAAVAQLLQVVDPEAVGRREMAFSRD